jgi:hypothetical protein
MIAGTGGSTGTFYVPVPVKPGDVLTHVQARYSLSRVETLHYPPKENGSTFSATLYHTGASGTLKHTSVLGGLAGSYDCPCGIPGFPESQTFDLEHQVLVGSPSGPIMVEDGDTVVIKVVVSSEGTGASSQVTRLSVVHGSRGL